MDKKKHYLVYKTTCLVNGKIYIGQHQTYDIEDNYLGSGSKLKRDIAKFGKEQFKREILFDFNTPEEMDNKEKELVTEEFVAREDTYNMSIGGQNEGWQFVMKSGLNNSANNCSLGGRAFANQLQSDPSFKKRWLEKMSDAIRRKRMEHPELFKTVTFLGKHHTKETKQKMREQAHLRVGEKNGSFGTVWIYNENLGQNKKVKREQVDDFLNQGWRLGRRMSFYK